jgi:hypothetical protein
MTTKKKATLKKESKPKKKGLDPIEVQHVQTITVKPLDPLAPGPKVPTNHFRLRLEAQAVYLADMGGCTVDDVHKDARFKDLAIHTLKRWAHEDDWAGKRKTAYANLQKRLTEEIGSKLTDRLYLEVQGLLKMLDKAHKILEDEKTPIRSWESVNDQILKMNKRLSEIHRMVAEGIVDDAGRAVEKSQQTQGATPKIPYDAATLQEISKMFTTRKREEMRARLAAKNAPIQKEPDHDEATAKGPEPGPTQGPPSIDASELPIPELAPSVVPNPGRNHGSGD